MHSSHIAVNRLTGSHTDRATHTPAYKETAVKMRLLDEVGESPLPRGNSRLGTPTPQRGVEVERKRLIDFVPEGVANASAKGTEPLGLLSLVRKFSSKNSRRGLAGAAEILETFGRHLDGGASP